MAEVADDPLDVCACGDYRRDHEAGGTGRCRVCYGSSAPYDHCGRFRLFNRATDDDRRRVAALSPKEPE